jgi:hypothetical protein
MPLVLAICPRCLPPAAQKDPAADIQRMWRGLYLTNIKEMLFFSADIDGNDRRLWITRIV